MKEPNIINLTANNLTKKRFQSTNKLPKIKSDERNKNEHNNKFDRNTTRRSYKFNTSKSVKIRISFP